MKRFSLLAGLAGLAGVAVLVGAGPAWAHEEINPSTVPTGKPVFLTLTSANEKQVRLTKVTLNAPSGLNFGATTRAPSGWTVNRTDTVITWTGGAVDPDRFESFGYEIEGADQPGTLNYKATLSYADGSNDDVTVPITATASGAASSGSGGSDSGSGRANVALALGAAALALAVVSLALGRRGGGAAAPAGGVPSSPASRTEQDW